MNYISSFKITCKLNEEETNLAKKTIKEPDVDQQLVYHEYYELGIVINLTINKDHSSYLDYDVDFRTDLEGDVWKVIKDSWKVIGFSYPFDDKKFFLSEISFFFYVELKSKEWAKEYSDLLHKSVWSLDEEDLSICDNENDIRFEYHEKRTKKLTDGRIVTCYNEEYFHNLFDNLFDNTKAKETKATKEIDMYDNYLTVSVSFTSCKQLQKILQLFNIHNIPIEKQIAFFMMNERMLIHDTIRSIYLPGKYCRKDFVENFIKNDTTLKASEREELISFFNECNSESSKNEIKKNQENLLNYFIKNNINLIALTPDFQEDNELPSIHELVASEFYEHLDESNFV